MTRFYLRLIGICLLVNCSAAASIHGDGAGSGNGNKHGDSDLDVVQCHHSVYRVPQSGGKPELVRGQESRVSARQYLPPPGAASPKEEDPAASFDQPNFLTVENTFISPTLQKNYNSLFSQKKPDVAPAAAQNVFSSAVPDTPRKSASIKHSHDEDDENNLERLCNDAFHSFLCKPIKGPRKTPTGRLRENAVLPPGVYAGQASFQDVSKVRPDENRQTSPSNNFGITVIKPTTKNIPIKPSPSNGYLPQRITSPQPIPTTTTTVIPFTYIYKPDKPVFPSPSNNNPQILVPQTPHDCEKSKPHAFIPNPSNQSPAFVKPYTTPTVKPYNVPLPSNNFPNIALPPRPQTTPPPHDCDKSKSTTHFSPSKPSPSFLKPYSPSTPKPFNKENNIQRIPFPSNNSPKVAPPPRPQTYQAFRPPTTPPHNCDQHRSPLPPFVNPTNQSPFAFKSQPTFKPLDKFKVPEASNNIAQIIAQPQEVKAVTVAPQKTTGYVYDKPAVPFPPPPTTQRPFPPSTPKPTTGYVYDPPRIPFASNTFNQVVSKPVQRTISPAPSPLPCEHGDHHSAELTNPTNENVVVLTPGSPRDSYTYNKPAVLFPPESSNPTNQNLVSLKPFVTTTQKPSTGYSYQSPKTPFLLPSSTNQFQRIASPTNTGYNYQKPEIPFPPQTNLPSNNNQIFVSTSKPSQPPYKPYPTTQKPFNGYSYEQPAVPFPNINSKLSLPSDTMPQYVAKPQTQVEVTVKPGYSYDKPSVPFSQTSAVSGYSYPKPSQPFPR